MVQNGKLLPIEMNIFSNYVEGILASLMYLRKACSQCRLFFQRCPSKRASPFHQDDELGDSSKNITNSFFSSFSFNIEDDGMNDGKSLKYKHLQALFWNLVKEEVTKAFLSSIILVKNPNTKDHILIRLLS